MDGGVAQSIRVSNGNHKLLVQCPQWAYHVFVSLEKTLAANIQTKVAVHLSR